MAFNPFTSFRKYQKFWMASLVLVSMVTFVLCAGIGGGGFEDIWFKLVGRRGGTAMYRIDGRTVTDAQLHDLKDQRNIANSFMRKAADINYQILKDFLKKTGTAAKDAKASERKRHAVSLARDLEDILNRPRYFEGDVKLDDLLDFMLWQQQADRLGIQFQDAQLRAEIWQGVHALDTEMWQNQYAWYRVYEHVRLEHQKASDPVIFEALRQEFRVRTAKLALLEDRPYAMMHPDSIHLQRKIDTRLALTPGQLWDYYTRNRTPMDIALLPVDVSHFLPEVTPPSQIQLQEFFQKHQSEKQDPASPVPGFEQPAQVKITWVTADPNSEYLRNQARTVTSLLIDQPVVLAPGLPGLGHVLEYAQRHIAWQTSLRHSYEDLRVKKEGYEYVPLTEPYYALDLYGRLFEKPTPALAATMVGEALPSLPFPLTPVIKSTGVFSAAAYLERPGKLESALEEEAQRRWPVGVTLLLSAGGSVPEPFTPLALYHAASQEPQYLPFDIVRAEFRKAVEHNLAVDRAREIMADARAELEKNPGDPGGIDLRLERLQEKYGDALQVRATKHFQTRFSIAQAPSMAGFLKSYERFYTTINQSQGTGGTEQVLKEDDFYRLFFGSDKFSVGPARPYDPHIWPPVVEIARPKTMQFEPETGELATGDGAARERDLWKEAESPIVFWKTKSQPEHVAASLKEIQPEVERAWKVVRARESLALPMAQKIAEELRKVQKQDGEYSPVLAKEAEKLHTQVITFQDVTPLVPGARRELAARDWLPYQMPKGKIPYPMPDMTNDLLALRDLKAPIKVSEEKGDGNLVRDVQSVVRALNKINAGLFDPSLNKEKADEKDQAPRKKVFQVQILTNRPRTVFYVAAVVNERRPSDLDFYDAWSGAARSQVLQEEATGRIKPGDMLVDRAQLDAARTLQLQFTAQLRRDARLEPIEDEAARNARAQFDAASR